MRQAITRAWFGHDGAYYRENIEPTKSRASQIVEKGPNHRVSGVQLRRL